MSDGFQYKGYMHRRLCCINDYHDEALGIYGIFHGVVGTRIFSRNQGQGGTVHMGLVSIGGTICTLSLSAKTYEDLFGYVMGDKGQSEPTYGYFRSKRHVTCARDYYTDSHKYDFRHFQS